MAFRQAAAPLPAQRSEIEIHLMHADWFASQGQLAQAIALYRTAATLAEQHRDVRRALTAWGQVARYEGVGSHARVRLGELLMELGQRSDAAQSFAAAANESMQLGRIDDGLRAYRRAAEAEPTIARWKQLLDWCLHLQRGEEGLAHLEEGANTLFAAREYPGFIAAAESLLEHRPDHVPTLRRLIRAYLEGKRMPDAVRTIQVLLRARPGDADALERMADAFAALGRRDKAAEVTLRLATQLRDAGPEARKEAARLVRRGLLWRPTDPELRAMHEQFQREAGAQPPVAREIVVPDQTPPLDLSEFVEAIPTHEHTVALSLADLMDVGGGEGEMDEEAPTAMRRARKVPRVYLSSGVFG